MIKSLAPTPYDPKWAVDKLWDISQKFYTTKKEGCVNNSQKNKLDQFIPDIKSAAEAMYMDWAAVKTMTQAMTGAKPELVQQIGAAVDDCYKLYLAKQIEKLHTSVRNVMRILTEDGMYQDELVRVKDVSDEFVPVDSSDNMEKR